MGLEKEREKEKMEPRTANRTYSEKKRDCSRSPHSLSHSHNQLKASLFPRIRRSSGLRIDVRTHKQSSGSGIGKGTDSQLVYKTLLTNPFVSRKTLTLSTSFSPSA